MNEKRLIVAGGGTGGHVLAGIAIADEWKKNWRKLTDKEQIKNLLRAGIKLHRVPKRLKSHDWWAQPPQDVIRESFDAFCDYVLDRGVEELMEETDILLEVQDGEDEPSAS